MHLKSRDRAYIAGLIDGEGCVCLHKYKSYVRHCWEYRFTCRIQIAMTCEKTIRFLSDKLSCACREIKPSREGYKKQWVIAIQSHRAIKLAKLILPFSITKKEQLEMMLEYEKTIFKQVYNMGLKGPSLPEELYKKRLEISEKFSNLNKRSKKESTDVL